MFLSKIAERSPRRAIMTFAGILLGGLIMLDLPPMDEHGVGCKANFQQQDVR